MFHSGPVRTTRVQQTLKVPPRRQQARIPVDAPEETLGKTVRERRSLRASLGDVAVDI